ncbi:hypothetical protein CR513_48421, partial [Mucuna pruriens]
MERIESITRKGPMTKGRLGHQEAMILCDVVPMEATHILLGRPWKFDRRVTYDGVLLIDSPLNICDKRSKKSLKNEVKVNEERPVAERRLSGHAGTLLNDLTRQYLANNDGTPQLLLAIVAGRELTTNIDLSNWHRCRGHTFCVPKYAESIKRIELESVEELCIIASMTRKRSSGRKSKNMHVGHASDSFNSITEIDNFEMKLGFSDNPLYEPNPMKNNNNRMLKELATLDSSKRLAVFTTNYMHHMRRYEANVPREVLFGIQDSDHP